MTETQWLYDLIAALDRITDEAQAVDNVPNVKEWVDEIRQEERERCLTRKFPIPARAIANLLDAQDGEPYDDEMTIRNWLDEFLAAAIREQEEDDDI